MKLAYLLVSLMVISQWTIAKPCADKVKECREYWWSHYSNYAEPRETYCYFLMDWKPRNKNARTREELVRDWRQSYTREEHLSCLDSATEIYFAPIREKLKIRENEVCPDSIAKLNKVSGGKFCEESNHLKPSMEPSGGSR